MGKRPRVASNQTAPVSAPMVSRETVQELRTLMNELTKVLADTREVITSGRQLQRDLRHDITRYKYMIHKDIEVVYEKQVNAAVTEMMRIINNAQLSAVQQVFDEFNKVRSALFSERTPAEVAVIAESIGNALAAQGGGGDARIAVFSRGNIKLTRNGEVPLVKSTTFLQDIEAEHLMFHQHNT